MTLLLWQIRYEQKAYWRNPLSAIFTFGFPMVLFVIFNSIFGNNLLSGGPGQPVVGSNYYTPSILSYAVMSACFLSITLQYTQRRELGIFKRMRGTPLPAWALVGGTIGSTVVIASIEAVLTLGLGRLAYHVHIPVAHLLPIAVTLVIAAVAFCALGIAVSSFIPNAEASPAIVNLPYIVLVFISGSWFPVHGTLAKVADYLPLRPFLLALKNAVTSPAAASGWTGQNIFHLVIWGAIGGFVAARRFRWEPKR